MRTMEGKPSKDDSVGVFSTVHLERHQESKVRASALVNGLRRYLKDEVDTVPDEYFKQAESMFLSEIELSISFEIIRYGKRSMNSFQISQLIQDLLLHFEEVYLAPWNLFDAVATVRYSAVAIVAAESSNNPFLSFVKRLRKMEACVGTARMISEWLAAWADLARCLSVLLSTSASKNLPKRQIRRRGAVRR